MIIKSPIEALEYLDDIAHGRQMNIDPHTLKLIVEKYVKGMKSIVKSVPLIYLLSGLIWSQISKEEIENIKDIYKELGKEESNGR